VKASGFSAGCIVEKTAEVQTTVLATFFNWVSRCLWCPVPPVMGLELPVPAPPLTSFSSGRSRSSIVFLFRPVPDGLDHTNIDIFVLCIHGQLFRSDVGFRMSN